MCFDNKQKSQSSSINLVSAMANTAYNSGLPRQNVGDKKQKVPKLAKARLLFPIVSCLGGYWLCISCVLAGYWVCIGCVMLLTWSVMMSSTSMLSILST